MRKSMVLVGLWALVGLTASWTHAAGVAGRFREPFDLNQHWQDCSQIGYTDSPTQYFMEMNSDLQSGPKYHLAEDWNGKCGGSSDKGAVLYALADGVVQQKEETPTTPDGSVANFDFSGNIRKLGINNSMAYRHQNSRKSKFATDPPLYRHFGDHKGVPIDWMPLIKPNHSTVNR
jgi:hypothetical protein